MIRRKEEYPLEIREHMRDGDGQVLISKIFSKEELFGKSRMFSTLTLEKDCGIGCHKHEDEQEYFYVLKGDPLYYDDGEEIQLHEGDSTICEDGHSHAICNRSDETAIVLACILLK